MATDEARQVIQSPGYHVRPKYDLKKFRERQMGNGKKEFSTVLPLTSMIDMFSMLVIFLILNFSSTGEVFFISKDLDLPSAQHGDVLKGLPLITVTKSSVIFDVEKVANNPLHLEERDQDLPRLRQTLQKLKAMHETVHPGKPFKGEVNIQADEGTPVIYIKRVMNTLIGEGWTGISFAVRPEEEG